MVLPNQREEHTMDEREERLTTAAGVTGFLAMLLGGIAYFFMGQAWQLVITAVGLVLLLVAMIFTEN